MASATLGRHMGATASSSPRGDMSDNASSFAAYRKERSVPADATCDEESMEPREKSRFGRQTREVGSRSTKKSSKSSRGSFHENTRGQQSTRELFEVKRQSRQSLSKDMSPEDIAMLQELRNIGAEIRQDCRDALKDVSNRLLTDIRASLRPLRNTSSDVGAVSIGTHDRHGLNNDPLRNSATATLLEPTWGMVGGVSLRPSSGGGIRKRSSPGVPRHQEAVTWAAGQVLEISSPETTPANAPEDSPPLMSYVPGMIGSSDEADMSAKKIPVLTVTRPQPPAGSADADEAAGGSRPDKPGKHKLCLPDSNTAIQAVSPRETPRLPGLKMKATSSTEWGSLSSLPSKASDSPKKLNSGGMLMRSKTFASEALREEQAANATRGERQRLNITREKAKHMSKNKDDRKSIWHMSIAELITTSMFDNVVGSIIILNALVIGIQTDYNARNLTDKVPLVFFILEQFFCIWFTGELSIRIYVYRLEFFRPCGDGWGWNYFDTLVVTAQLAEIMFEAIARGQDVDVGDFRLLRVLRILRLVRILRVVRVLHLISELRAIVSSIVGSFRSLVWVVVLLTLMIYIVAVFFTQSVTDHVVQSKEDAKGNANEWEANPDEAVLMDYFGSLGRALLSLWQAISGGLDWDSLANPFFGQVSFLTGAIFTCFIGFALLALMNVVTGVFVQTALLSARDEEDSFMTAQIIQLFRVAHEDENVTITMEQITDSLEDPETFKEWNSIGVQAEDARYLFKLLDLDNIGEVAFEEFLGGCLRLSGGAKAVDVLTVMQEARRTNEQFLKKFGHIEDAMIDIHESTQDTGEDVGRIMEDMNDVIDSSQQQQEEFRHTMYSMEATFAEMKTTMGQILGAIITDSQPADGDLV